MASLLLRLEELIRSQEWKETIKTLSSMRWCAPKEEQKGDTMDKTTTATTQLTKQEIERLCTSLDSIVCNDSEEEWLLDDSDGFVELLKYLLTLYPGREELLVLTSTLWTNEDVADDTELVEMFLEAFPQLISQRDKGGNGLLHILCARYWFWNGPNSYSHHVLTLQAAKSKNDKGEIPLMLCFSDDREHLENDFVDRVAPRHERVGGSVPKNIAQLLQAYPESLYLGNSLLEICAYWVVEEERSFMARYEDPYCFCDYVCDCYVWDGEEGLNPVDTFFKILLDATHPAGMEARDTDGSLPVHLACAHPFTNGVATALRLMVQLYPKCAQETDALGRLPLQRIMDAAVVAIESEPDDTHYCRQHNGNNLLKSALEIILQANPAALGAPTTGDTPLHIVCGDQWPSEWEDAGMVLLTPTTTTNSREILAAAASQKNNDGSLPLHVYLSNRRLSFPIVRALLQAYPSVVTVRDPSNDKLLPFVAASLNDASSTEILFVLLRENPTSILGCTGIAVG